MSETMPDTVRVFDTWVKGTKGTVHFDVMTTDEATALRLGQVYMAQIGESAATLTTKECQYCHSEPSVMFSAEQQQQLKDNGGFIVPMPA